MLTLFGLTSFALFSSFDSHAWLLSKYFIFSAFSILSSHLGLLPDLLSLGFFGPNSHSCLYIHPILLPVWGDSLSHCKTFRSTLSYQPLFTSLMKLFGRYLKNNYSKSRTLGWEIIWKCLVLSKIPT